MRVLALLQKLADAESLSPEMRAEIRAQLIPVVNDLRRELETVAEALDKPDPEFGLYVARQVFRDYFARLRQVEAKLAERQRRRKAG